MSVASWSGSLLAWEQELTALKARVGRVLRWASGSPPSSSFKILRARDRVSLAINPFRTDTHPGAQTGVAMITA